MTESIDRGLLLTGRQHASPILPQELDNQNLLLETPIMAVSDIQYHDPEKNTTLHVDDKSSTGQDLKDMSNENHGDYSGAVAKTDPKEIALVRKLDMRIMPALFCMYFL